MSRTNSPKPKGTRAVPKTIFHIRTLTILSVVALLGFFVVTTHRSAVRFPGDFLSAPIYKSRPLAGVEDQYTHSSFRQAPSTDTLEVHYRPKPLLEVIVGSFSDTVCAPPSKGSVIKAHPSPSGSKRTVLPQCYYGATKRDSSVALCSNHSIVAPPPKIPNNIDESAVTWRSISPIISQRIAHKVLKVIFTNRGCDEGFEGGMPSNIRDEVFDLVRTEHSGQLAVLHYGSGGPKSALASCDSGAAGTTENHFSFLQHLAEFFGPTQGLQQGGSPKSTNTSVQLQLMGIDAHDAYVKWGKQILEPKIYEQLAEGKGEHQSAIAHCASETAPIPTASSLTALHWIPSNTFNMVLVDDIESMLPDLNNNNAVKQPQSVKTADLSSTLCSLAQELVRVTKVGGTVWLGHIGNALHRNALLQCAFSDCAYELDPDVASSGDQKVQRYGVSVTIIRERTWLAQTGVPEVLWKQSPVSVMYRKFKISEADSELGAVPKMKGKKIKGDLLSL